MSKAVELLNYISSLDYRECRTFLLRQERKRVYLLEDKKPTRFLYKYLGVDAPIKKTRAESIVVDSKLWFASPASFNDPFDMKWKTIIEGTPQEKRARLLRIMGQNPDIATGNRSYRESEASRILADPIALLERVNQSGLKNANNAGVLSLTSEPRSILMWSHYAAHHTGIALQFEIARHPKFFVPAVTVKYSRDYPIRNWVDDSHKDLEKGLYGKYEDWSYESERRIIHADFANNHLPYKPLALTAIILGCCFTEFEWLKTILTKRGERHRGLPLKVYKANQSDSQYRLKIIEDLSFR